MRETNEENKKLISQLIFSRNRISIFRKIPVNRGGFLLLNLPKRVQRKIINKLETEEVIRVLHFLDLDRVVDLLQCLKREKAKKIIKKLNTDIRKKVEFLFKFDPRTAAGLMNLNYIEVDKNLIIKDVLEMVKKYEKRTKKFPEIIVVDNGFLLGELEGHRLFSSPGEKIEKFVRKIPSVKYNESEKEIVKVFKKNPRKQIAVLDDDKSVLGIIYADDILKIIEKKTGEDLYSFAGINEEEDVYDSAIIKVRNRYKWLIINLGTAFLAAFVVSLFEKTISAFVLLAVYMPIVAGMGGNAGTQTLAVVVRGLALGEIELKRVKRIIVNEVTAGVINGIIDGIIVAGVAIFFNKAPLLGVLVGVAMVINLAIAGFFGAIIPLVMKKIGKDPASSATIFITTATDVCGFFVFLGLASILL